MSSKKLELQYSYLRPYWKVVVTVQRVNWTAE